MPELDQVGGTKSWTQRAARNSGAQPRLGFGRDFRPRRCGAEAECMVLGLAVAGISCARRNPSFTIPSAHSRSGALFGGGARARRSEAPPVRGARARRSGAPFGRCSERRPPKRGGPRATSLQGWAHCFPLGVLRREAEYSWRHSPGGRAVTTRRSHSRDPHTNDDMQNLFKVFRQPPVGNRHPDSQRTFGDQNGWPIGARRPHRRRSRPRQT